MARFRLKVHGPDSADLRACFRAAGVDVLESTDGRGGPAVAPSPGEATLLVELGARSLEAAVVFVELAAGREYGVEPAA